jgi:DNA-binding GntR family transcriptional regulator
MSATPVREALKRLVSEAVLTQADHHSVRLPVLTPERYLEICDLRVELEGRAAAVAADRATEDDVEALKVIQLRLEAAARERRLADWLMENERFHMAICDMARLPSSSVSWRFWLRRGRSSRVEAEPVPSDSRIRTGRSSRRSKSVIAKRRALIADDILRIARSSADVEARRTKTLICNGPAPLKRSNGQRRTGFAFRITVDRSAGS